MMIYQRIESLNSGDFFPYNFVPLDQEHLEPIRLWRNQQLSILRQDAPITEKEQLNYFSNVIRPSLHLETPKIILFAFLFEKKLIGYGGLVNVDWRYQRGEVSFLLDPERHLLHYETDFSSFLQMLIRVAFTDLKMHRIYTETYSFRHLHIEILEKNGFQYEGKLREHVMKEGHWHDSLMHGLLKKDFDFL